MLASRSCYPGYLCFLLGLCFFLLSYSPSARAGDIAEIEADATEAWLVTFGPGEIYWERFGHNAIWLREPAAGFDHTFNFGYFDFEQEDFFFRFLRGRMLYFSIAQSASREFEYYRQQGRSIRLQRLNLNAEQYQRLRDHLVTGIRKENRDYRYDYYLDNCSTRIRDAIDVALNGEFKRATQQLPAAMNFRDQTRRLTQMQFWYYLGLEAGLGLPVDRFISRWEEMFIPMVVAEQAALATNIGTGTPLVSSDSVLYAGTLPIVATTPDSIWYRYALFGLVLTVMVWLSSKLMSPVWIRSLCHAWLIVAGTCGLMLTFLWLFTDHSVASPNVNLLLLNPLVLLGLIPSLRRIAVLVLSSGVVMGFALLLFPQHQYNLDLLMLLTPVNLATAWFFRSKSC